MPESHEHSEHDREHEHGEGPEDAYSRRILDSVRRILRAGEVNSRWLAAEHSVTAPQLMVLVTVVDRAPVTATEIGRSVHLSTSTVVGILDRLQEKDLVTRRRDREDRRLVFIEPTDQGRQLTSEAPYPLQRVMEEALEGFSEPDRARLAASLEELVAAIDTPHRKAG